MVRGIGRGPSPYWEKSEQDVIVQQRPTMVIITTAAGVPSPPVADWMMNETSAPVPPFASEAFGITELELLLPQKHCVLHTVPECVCSQFKGTCRNVKPTVLCEHCTFLCHCVLMHD